MARMKHGPYGPIVGRLGNTVGYVRLGQEIVRMVKTTAPKPPSLKQQAARAKMALVSAFIKEVNHFTNISFKPKSRQTLGKTAQNMAISANMKSAVTGNFPDYLLDATKLMLSEGRMELPPGCAVELSGDQLRFSWQGGMNVGYPNSTEQVMMLAYFPESGRSAYIAGGARRTAEADVLPLDLESNETGITETYAESYIAFISNDREQVSNSLYLGRVAFT